MLTKKEIKDIKNSHLVSILQTFSKKEIRETRKWLHSPIHNQREDVVDLFDYLVSGNHLWEDKFLQKERIFRKIFPKESYNDAKLRQSIHFLLKSIESYLITKQLQEDAIQAKMALVSIYRKRKLTKAFQKTINEVQDLQDKALYQNEQFFRNEYLIQQEQYLFLEGQKKRNIPMNLQEVSDALDTTFLADKLRQACLMLSHQKVYKTKYEIGLFNEIMRYIEENDRLNTPAISIYYFVYQAISDVNNVKHFENLKRQIQDYGHLFPPEEIKDIYLMAINYCIGKMNAGFTEFMREAFELYKKGLEKKILIENNSISPWTFINVAVNGLRLREFTWVESFIQNFKQYLPSPKRESIVLFTRSKLYFEKKDYPQAMDLLNKGDFEDLLIYLSAKTMLLKMYYELDEYDALDYQLDSLGIYIKRKQIMGYHKENYQNIIRYTKKIARVNPYSKKDVQHLQEEIQSANPLTEREWLLEQLQNM